jgi:hypothetical protein
MTFDGNLIHVDNIRNFKFDEEGPIYKGYENRTYDLNELNRVWFFVEPFSKWDGVAHTMFSFDFDDGQTVTISVEARKEKNEKYSALSGIFNKYELIYIWGNEYDLLARRTKTAGYDIYMFPLKTSKEFAQKLLLDLANTTHKLETVPKFYNTFFSNCTNTLANAANNVVPGTIPWNWARILPGYSEEFLYKHKFIDASGTLSEIKEKYSIKEIVNRLEEDINFSKNLREELAKSN